MSKVTVGYTLCTIVAVAFWAGRRTADVAGVFVGIARKSDMIADDDDEEDDRRNLAVEMFDAVHDIHTGDWDVALEREGLTCAGTKPRDPAPEDRTGARVGDEAPTAPDRGQRWS